MSPLGNTLIFPNSNTPDPAIIQAGNRYHIPSPYDSFEFQIFQPIGNQLIGAICRNALGQEAVTQVIYNVEPPFSDREEARLGNLSDREEVRLDNPLPNESSSDRYSSSCQSSKVSNILIELSQRSSQAIGMANI